MTHWQVLCGVSNRVYAPGCLNLDRVCNASSCGARAFPYSPLPFRLALARAAAVRTRAAGVASPSGENLMFSIVVGYGVGTLFATGLLLVMQLLEDFRDA